MMEGSKEVASYSSPRFSQTSYRLMTLGCLINFMITTSRSIPNGITRKPATVLAAGASLSICAMLALWTSAADFLETILIAAVCPVRECLASRTRPVAPFPNVLPNCHGPTWVFRLDLAEAVDVVEMAELRFDSGWVSFAIADMRLFSATIAGPGSPLTLKQPSGFKDS